MKNARKLLIGLSSFVLLTSLVTGCKEPVEELTPQEKVDSAIASVIYSNLNGVVADFDLITEIAGLEEVDLTYTVAEDASAYLALSEDATKMLVTRPEFDEDDAMLKDAFTVTATYKDATASKDFNVKIIKKGNEVTVGEFRELTAGNNAPYVVYGTVVAENAKGLLIGDATGVVYAYDSALCEVADPGDYVKVEGGWAAYGGVPQFSYSAADGAVTVTKLSGQAPAEHQFTTPELETWTGADCDAYLNETTVDALSGHYVNVVGTLSISGSYYNVNISGASTAVGSIVYPTESMAAELAELDGKLISVTGYSLYISGGKYVNIFTTDVAEVTLDDSGKVDAAADGLKVSATASSDFSLPATGLYDTSVSWVSSSDALVIGAADNGSYPVDVTRGSQDITATLTATISLNGAETTRNFTVTIPADNGRTWSTIEEVYAMTEGDVTVRGIYQGKNNKLSAYNNVDQVNSAFIADGDKWLQVYQGAASLYEGLTIGDAIEVKGSVAHYTSSDAGSLTTYEVKPTEITKLDSTDGLTTPSWITIDAENTPTFAQADVNKGVHVVEAEVVSNTVGSYDNVTLIVKAGSTEYTLYLDSRYTDVTDAKISGLKAGDVVSFDSFVGANKTETRLIYVNNLVVTEGQGGGEVETPVEPQFVKKSIADLAAYTADNNTVFEASGVIQNIANTTYGNFYLVDPATGAQLLVYGLSAENDSVLSYVDNGDGTYLGTYGTNNQSYNSLGLAEGDYITMRGVIALFNNKPQLKGIFVEKADSWISGDYTVATTTADAAKGTVTTDKTSYKYGEKVTLNITPATGYRVDKVEINQGYTGTSYADNYNLLEDVDGVYSFNAKIVNNVKVTFADASVAKTYACDFTTKAAKNQSYTNVWTYDGYTISGGANNNGGWDYVKIGGKSDNLAKLNDLYIASPVVENEISKVTVNIAAGSLSKSGMAVTSWGVYVYSDADMTQQIDYVAGGTITSSAGSFEFVPSTGTTWAANSYYKVVFVLTNSTTTNGIVCISSIVFA